MGKVDNEHFHFYCSIPQFVIDSQEVDSSESLLFQLSKMAKLNLKTFHNMVQGTWQKEVSLAFNANYPILTNIPQVFVENINNEPVKDLATVKIEDPSLDKEVEKNRVMLTDWLVKLVTPLWVKMSEHAEIAGDNLDNEVEDNQAKVVRTACAERCARREITSTEDNKAKAILMRQEKVEGGSRLETVSEMCCRLLVNDKKKEEVTMVKPDISACHVLGRNDVDSTYIYIYMQREV